MAGKEIEKLTKLIAKLPSLGTRSSRRIVLQLLKKRESLFLPLIEALQEVAANVKTCEICGNYDTVSPCSICASEKHHPLRGAGRCGLMGNGKGFFL